MEAPTILGLSFNTRNQGLAVVKSSLLVDYSSKLHKEKWTPQKRDMILTSLGSCIDNYNIEKITLSIPSPRHRTTEFSDLMAGIIELAEVHHIEVITYTRKDLFLFIPDSQKKTRKAFMQQMVLLFPELESYFLKEI